MKHILANLQLAVRNREQVIIAGGTFFPEELCPVIKAIESYAPENENVPSRTRLIEIIDEAFNPDDFREIGIGDCLIDEIAELLKSYKGETL